VRDGPTLATPLIELEEPDIPLASRRPGLSHLVPQRCFGEPGAQHAVGLLLRADLALSHPLAAVDDPLTHGLGAGRER